MDVLYKVIVRSVVDYALPIYEHIGCFVQSYCKVSCRLCLSYEIVQHRAAKLVAGAFHFTSKDKSNAESGWETI